MLALSLLFGAIGMGVVLNAVLDDAEDEFRAEVDLFLTGDEGQTIIGTESSDFLDGRGGDDNIDARGGDDILDGGTGRDLLYGGAGDDVLRGEQWNDVLIGGDGDDTILGGDGADQVMAGYGDDAVDLGTWSDFAAGGDGADTIRGGIGGDDLHAGLIFSDDIPFDVALEAMEAERSGAEFVPTAAAGAIRVLAVHDDDVDVLVGGAGDDVLALGKGDIGTGGEGSDTFELFFDPADDDSPALTRVTDYTPDEDVIELAYLDGNARPTVTVENEDEDAIILADDIAIARIEGVAAEDVRVSDADVTYRV